MMPYKLYIDESFRVVQKIIIIKVRDLNFKLVIWKQRLQVVFLKKN